MLSSIMTILCVLLLFFNQNPYFTQATRVHKIGRSLMTSFIDDSNAKVDVNEPMPPDFLPTKSGLESSHELEAHGSHKIVPSPPYILLPPKGGPQAYMSLKSGSYPPFISLPPQDGPQAHAPLKRTPSPPRFPLPSTIYKFQANGLPKNGLTPRFIPVPPKGGPQAYMPPKRGSSPPFISLPPQDGPQAHEPLKRTPSPPRFPLDSTIYKFQANGLPKSGLTPPFILIPVPPKGGPQAYVPSKRGLPPRGT